MAAQCICDHIVLALLVASNKRVVLKILHPTCVSVAQVLLQVEVLQGFIVREEHKLLGQEVMAPVSQCLNDDLELIIVGGVLKPNVIQLLVEELNEVAIIAKDTPNADARGITGDFKHLLKSGNRRTDVWVIKAFSLSNACLAALIHWNVSSLRQSVIGVVTKLKFWTSR